MRRIVPTRRGAIGAIAGAVAATKVRAAENAAKSVATSPRVGANPYPVEFRLGRDAPPHPFEYIPAAEHAAIIEGRSSYDASTDLQAMLDGWTPTEGYGGVQSFPIGRFALGQPLYFPNWVAWQGMGRASQLYILPDHTGPLAFSFDSDPRKRVAAPASQFNQFLSHFDINCNSASRLKKVIYAPSWNEKCGLFWVLMRDIPAIALEADEFHGGSAGWAIEHCEFMFNPAASVGIKLVGEGRDGTPIINRPQIRMNNVSMVGGSAPTAGASSGFVACEVDNLHVQLAGAFHVEKAWAAFRVDHNASLTGQGLTGSDDAGRVCNLVVRAATHTGQIDLADCYPGSASGARAMSDFKARMMLTLPIGGRIQAPLLPGSAWADGRILVSGGVISGVPELRGCSGVARISTGIYQVDHSDAFAEREDYLITCEARGDLPCYAVTIDSERTGEMFFIRVYRHGDDAQFDPSELSFRVYRRPGL